MAVYSIVPGVETCLRSVLCHVVIIVHFLCTVCLVKITKQGCQILKIHPKCYIHQEECHVVQRTLGVKFRQFLG